MRQNTIIIGVVAILTLLVLWYVNGDNDTQDPAETGQVRQGPDYRMKSFTVTVMNESGRVNYTLTAKYMDHFTKSDVTLLQEPKIAFFQDSKQQWYIHADKGRVTENAKQVLLQGKVTIKHQSPEERKPTYIVSSDVLVMTENQTVQTEHAVQIIHPSATVNAVGLKADLKQNKVSLLSAVKSRYMPATPARKFND